MIVRTSCLSPSARRTAAAASCAILLLIAGCHQKSASNAPATNHVSTSPMEQALHADADAGHLSSLHWPDFSDYKPIVESFYQKRGWNPAWVDGHSVTTQAISLAKLFAMSGDKGLNPEDYDASLWPARLRKVATANDQQLAEFDTAMTVCAMRYISDLHIGRVNPSHFSFGVNVQAKKYDLANFIVEQVVAAGSVEDVLKSIEPDSDNYRETIKALNRYQDLAKQAGDAPELPMPGRALSAGSPYAGAGELAKRLVLLGDMDGDADAGTTYTHALADGVKNFQVRHGIAPDGRLNPKTVAALNVPLATRVHQLEDTLERLRWLAPEYQNAPVFVNIPEFLLRVYGDDHKEAFQMRVVVGQAKEDEHKTPVLSQEMKYVVLRPFWNVTPTIVKEEIVPHVQADRGYIDAKNFEVVTRGGKPVPNWTVDAMAHGMYMVREKPGPTNSLGLIKFMFPNKLNIYLHSTPAVQLFDRGRRDFSHGCVRIQDPEKLADWVLGDKQDWTPDKIHDAMENGQDNKTVALSHPIPVLIFYATARVGEDGKTYFFNDIYGYDQQMEDTLSKGAPYPVKPLPKKETADTA